LDAPQRKIIHCDCDCFYAAVELRDDPSLAGKPVAVGGSPDRRGVVATCNYEARHHGVRSAMPTARAIRLCPDLVVLRPAMDRYREVSRAIMAIYRDFTPIVEPLSLDEAYLDVSHASAHSGSGTRIAQAIRERVRNEIGITVSAGVAPNKFLAKIASDWKKPDGLFVIRPPEVEAFVAALPIEKLHGVGAATAARLKKSGMETCADVRSRSLGELRNLVGVLGERLYELSRGVDRREVTPDLERKSLSVEETYVEDLPGLADCRRELAELVAELTKRAARLQDDEAIERIFVKIRFDNFQKTAVERAGSTIDEARFMELLEEGVRRVNRPVRLLGAGLRIGRASAKDQMDLFVPD